MPDEHDDAGPEAPHRPVPGRRQTFRTEEPGPDGNTVQDQRRQAAGPQADAKHSSLPDPRFARAPMSLAEKKALHAAGNVDEACQVLGHMQEARLKDGRLPPAAPQAQEFAPFINQCMPFSQQIDLALQPTPQQLAYILRAGTLEEEKRRTNEFLGQRAAQNRDWFQRSRHWGPEIDRQERAGQPLHDERIKDIGGRVQAWRSELTDVRRQVGSAGAEVTNPTRATASETASNQPPSLDPRFAKAPITAAEWEALHLATREGARQLLGQMHEARLKDGRQSETSSAHPEKAEINQFLTLDQQIRLGLRPTAEELAYMQAGAIKGQEHHRTMEFLAVRNAQNDRLFERSRNLSYQEYRQQEDADRNRADTYWFEQKQNSTPSAERDARRERGERRTDLEQQKAEVTQRRDNNPQGNPNQGRQSNERGGAER